MNISTVPFNNKSMRFVCRELLFNCTKPAAWLINFILKLQVLTWINPTVNVSVGGNFEPAIAIPSREISTFTSLKSAVS